ncbi:MAG: hypothetical protein Q8Q58_05060, partial [Candidatus Rokubacteria bacterium]|nr:hypothetical protein [Candidatus Rokubacteria bacterium]
AYSPRYWEKYLELLTSPLARLVDLLLIKQGEKIARQKGWTRPKRERRAAPAKGTGGRQKEMARRAGRRRRAAAPAPTQQSLFPDLPA